MRDRALALGLGASIAAHSAVLALTLFSTMDVPIAPPIVARLVEPQIEPLPAPIPVPQRVVRKVVAPAARAPAAPELPEATTQGQYRYLLAAAAVRYNAYPPEANGAEGDVVIRIGVDASGRVSDVSLARSSGHVALDDRALETFRQAAREVAVPRALRGRPFGVELKTIYRESQRSG
jgi:periplasmic protein TonB